MKQKLITFFLVASFSLNAIGQNENSNNITSPRLNKQYFKSALTDIKDITIAPLSMTKTQWLTLWAIAGTGYFVYSQDLKIQQFSQNQRTPTTELISKHGLEPLGSGLYTGSLIGLLYLHGTLAKNDRTKRVALLSAKTLVVISPFIILSKAAFYRDRPYYSTSPDHDNWYGLAAGIRGTKSVKDFNFSTAFPSGHTTSAFAIATIIASEYKDEPIVPIVAYSLATLAGISRIHDNKHWASDVFGGAVFGYTLAKIIYNQNNARFTLAPYKTKNETGLYFSMPIKGNS